MNMIRQTYSVSKVCDIRTANVAFIHTILYITIPQNSGNSFLNGNITMCL